MEVLERGGNAIDAMVSAAAMIAVAYPHMNGLGGDSFWIVHQPGSEPWAIDASGAAASAASPVEPIRCEAASKDERDQDASSCRAF